MKMDVEGSEWDSLLKTPDTVLSDTDQMAVEFHEVEKPAFLGVWYTDWSNDWKDRLLPPY
jgi:hypothetical protein